MQPDIKMDGAALHLADACPPPPLHWHGTHDFAIKQVSKLIWLKTCPRNT